MIDNIKSNDYKCIPISNTETILFDPPQGSYILDLDTSPDSIYFEVYHIPYEITSTWYSVDILETKMIPLDETIDEIIIHTDKSIFDYRVFNNTPLKIRGRKIIFFDKEKKRTNVLKLIPDKKYD